MTDAARVLGIDPGLRLTGYACVELRPGAADPALVEAGVLRLRASTPLEARLQQLHEDLIELMDELRPTRLVVEQVFVHREHARTAILMAHARGVVLLSGRLRGLAIDEVAPAAVKKAVTGRGRATKLQMQMAVMGQCDLPVPPRPADVADAIAIALTGARRALGPSIPGTSGIDWSNAALSGIDRKA